MEQPPEAEDLWPFDSWMPAEPDPLDPAGLADDSSTDASSLSPEEEAVLAYCRKLLPPATAEEAAADVLVAWRERVGAGAERSPIPPDELLLAITRLMTAVSLPDQSSPSDRRRAVMASIGATPRSSCRETGVLLASRANRNIAPREQQALDHHLSACHVCREIETRLGQAEDAYLAKIDR